MILMSSINEKNPLIAALLNFFIWGSGYLYIGNNPVFGYGLILVAIFEHSPVLITGIGLIFTYPFYIYVVGHLILSIILAYDAYNSIK